MRVILAMAERYQPRSVKQRSSMDATKGSMHVSQGDMTRTVHMDRKGSHSPEGILHGLTSSLAANSFSVPNMASMNVSSSGRGRGGGVGGGGERGGPRPGSRPR